MKTLLSVVLAVTAICTIGLATCRGGNEDKQIEDVDLTGYWAVYGAGGEGEPPDVIYLLQTGSSIEFTQGTGTIEGSILTFQLCDGTALTVQMESPDLWSSGGVRGERLKGLSSESYYDVSGLYDLDIVYDPGRPTSDPHGLGRQREDGEIDVVYIDVDSHIEIVLEPPGPMSAGTFAAPGEIDVWLDFDETAGVCGPTVVDISEHATSGDLVITGYQAGVSIEGYFENMVFPSGALSASFRVFFEIP